MKVFKFEYYERWISVQGIVIADTIDAAKRMMRDPYPLDKTVEELFPNLRFEEIDVTKPRVIDMTYTE